ncbi:MAG: B12-binding domain-containing radical SAM protein [Candidatus Anammoxibacter sp.]
MKVLFIYYDVNSSAPARYACGIGSLSAYLKKHNHDISLVYIKTDDDYKLLREKINDFDPDLIGISATTSGFCSINDLSSYIKQITPETLLIIGGSHISILPEDINSLDHVDGACIGYGEIPLLQLLSTIEKGGEYLKTPGFWFKKNGVLIKNEKALFPDDWNEFFNFDREIFFDELNRLNPHYCRISSRLLGERVFEYIVCRACSFNCSFCAAPLIKTWGKGDGWLGRPSSETVVKKLSEDAKKYKLTGFAFHDDVFTFKNEWFLEFAELYKKELRLPYLCNLRVGTFDGPVLDALADSNCKVVGVGIESGNEYIRNKIANRKISNEKMITDLVRLKNAGIEVSTNNMIGFPDETFDQFMDTININAIVGPSRAFAFIYYPYPGTALYTKCINEGLIKPAGNEVIKERKQSILQLPNFDKKKIERIAPVFYPLVMYQRLIYKLFGLESVFSLKYTEPIISRLVSPMLASYFVLRKVLRKSKDLLTLKNLT